MKRSAITLSRYPAVGRGTCLAKSLAKPERGRASLSASPASHGGARRQRGIAAVELAIILPVLVLLLVFPLYFGRVYWHYTVIQQAAQDAARYLSKVPAVEISHPTRAPAVVAVANAIVDLELAELAPGAYPYAVTVTCGGGTCVGFSIPTTVRVNIQMYMQDIFFSGYTNLTIPLTADITYPYMGR